MGGLIMTNATYSPGQRVSEYLLVQPLGQGSFAEVWEARHHVWETERVAAKLPVAPDYVRYLQREGVVVHGLRHPNIVRVLGLDPYAERPYLLMELVHGPSLRQVLTDHPAGLAPPLVITITRGILRAMDVAHAAGVLHRDLKPSNVLLNLADRRIEQVQVDDVKVSDFGLGLSNPDMLQSLAQSASIAREDGLVGTLAYMAPELRDGHGVPSAKTDLYSIGVMLFELLTGERPAGAELPSTVRSAVPPALDDVFRRLYARHDRRFASAAEALTELDRLVGAEAGRPAGSANTACPQCREPIGDRDNFCMHCGHQLQAARRCQACGGYPRPDDHFCIFCGNRLAPALT